AIVARMASLGLIAAWNSTCSMHRRSVSPTIPEADNGTCGVPTAVGTAVRNIRAARCSTHGTCVVPAGLDRSRSAGSELRDAGEGPAVDAQGGYHRRAEEALDRLARAAHRADARERVEVRLREPQVPHRPDDLAALDQEGAVAGHAGDHCQLRVHNVRVVEAGHEQA